MKRKKLIKTEKELFDVLRSKIKFEATDQQIRAILNALVDTEITAIQKCKLSVIMPYRRRALKNAVVKDE